MEEIICFLLVIQLFVFVGFVFLKDRPKEKESNAEFGKNENIQETEEYAPMKLRNGFGITRDKNPTFAEQWVNIMNYNGESQTEENYEENERDYPEGDLE